VRRFLLFLCLFSVVSGWRALPCRAETISVCDAAASDDYLTKTSGQFLRGTTGIAFCWLELIHQPALEWRSERKNLFIGAAKGVGHTFLRIVKGIGDIATCASPHRDEDGGFPSVTQDCPFGSVGLEDR